MGFLAVRLAVETATVAASRQGPGTSPKRPYTTSLGCNHVGLFHNDETGKCSQSNAECGDCSRGISRFQ